MRAKQIYKGRIVDQWLEQVTLPNGNDISLEVIHHPGAAAIAAIDEDQQVILVRQFRHAVGGYIIELPAGTLDAGEAPATCAARELREEAGVTAGELIELGSVVTTPGFCDERIYLFLARHLADTAQDLQHDEVLTVMRCPLPEAMAMVSRGEIQDAKSIAGLYLASSYVNGK